MKKLEIINRSGQDIQLTEFDLDIYNSETITLQPDGKYKYVCRGQTGDETIHLRLPDEDGELKYDMYLYLNFMNRNKIAYVRKGDGDCWFVDPIRRGTKLVRKCVHNGTTSQIAVAEFVAERIGETQRLPGRDGPEWTAWWEITVDPRSRKLLIVDGVAVKNKVRRYFLREGGGPQLSGSSPQLNIPEIIMTRHNEHVEVERPDGMLDWTSSRRPWFLV